MCGLYGIIRLNKDFKIPPDFVVRLQQEATEQGRGANGWIKLDKLGLEYHKNKGSKLLLPNLEEATYFLGHNRSMQRDLNENDNNHPVVSENHRVLVMHTGSINAEHFYRNYEIIPYLTVDTSAIAEVLSKKLEIKKEGDENIAHTINVFRETLEEINEHGIASVIAIDTLHPELILIYGCESYPLMIRAYRNAIVLSTDGRWMIKAGIMELQEAEKLGPLDSFEDFTFSHSWFINLERL